MDYTDDEIADAARDMIALVRADLDDDKAGIEAIIGGASDRELGAVLRTFAGSFSDLMIRLTVATGLIQDEQVVAVIARADRDTLAANPGIREAVHGNIEAIQAGIIGSG
jgi:hypothetical protein